MCRDVVRFFFFFFNDTATTEIYTLSLHDALPISRLVLLQVHADQHLARGAEVLHLGLEAGAVERLADALDVGRALVADLDQRAAGELDREVEAAVREEEHGGEERNGGDDVEDQRVPHERDGAADLEEFHSAHVHAVSPIDRCATRLRWP